MKGLAVRSKRRLEIEIKEIKAKLTDIENAYPWPDDCPKSEMLRYNDLYEMLKERTAELERLSNDA